MFTRKSLFICFLLKLIAIAFAADTPVETVPDYNVYGIQIVNDMVQVLQTFLTCNPMWPYVGSEITRMQVISCTYNGLASVMNISSKMLEAFDVFLADTAFAKEVEKALNSYVNDHLENPRRNSTTTDYIAKVPPWNKNKVRSFDADVLNKFRKLGNVVFRPLDLTFRVYFKDKLETTSSEKIGCVVASFGSNTVYSQKRIQIETCMSRHGVKKMVQKSKQRTIVMATVKSYRLLKQFGYLNFLSSPVEFQRQLVHLFKEQIEETMEKMKSMVEKVSEEKWNGKNVSFAIHDRHDHEKFMYSVDMKKIGLNNTL